MKKLVFVFVLVFLLAGSAARAENVKIGFVDLVKALNECDTGKKAKADLEFLIKSKQGSLDEKGKAIEKLKGDLEKQASVLSADAKRSKEDELERLIRDYQRMVSDSQNELRKKEGDITGEIIKEIRELVEKTGKEEGYTMIFENAEGMILYSQKELDLTDTVIKKYNELKAAKAKK